MTLTAWFALAAICALGAMSPGPSLALMIRNTVSGGTRQGLATAVGHGVGVAIYAAITAMGLGLVISQTPWLFSLMQYAGAGFLLFQAVKILRSQQQNGHSEKQAESGFTGFNGGFLVTFLNPKMAIFFLALFSQFLTAEQGITEHMIMVATASLIDMAWYMLVVLSIAGTGLLAVLQRNGVWVDRLSALAFIGLAGFVLFN